MFAEFDPEPVAAASIAQAHQATLPGGEQVIVKVQRPGIAEAVDIDLSILCRLARRVEGRTAWGASCRVSDLADTGRLQQSGADRRKLADVLLRSALRVMLLGERFHADPHPGNVWLLDDGRLGLLDFGSTGRLDALEQASAADMLIAIRCRDPAQLRDAVLSCRCRMRRCWWMCDELFAFTQYVEIMLFNSISAVRATICATSLVAKMLRLERTSAATVQRPAQIDLQRLPPLVGIRSHVRRGPRRCRDPDHAL